MKTETIFALLLLAAAALSSGCAKPESNQRPPSDEVLIAKAHQETQKAVIDLVKERPEISLPASLALLGATSGMPPKWHSSLASLQTISYNSCSPAALCSFPPAAVDRQGENGQNQDQDGGAGAAQAAPAAGADSPVLSLSGPRRPSDQRDQRKAPISLPGPVGK